MADENINFEVTGFQNFKTQIREAQIEYQKLLADVNASPAAIAAAAAKVGELKDEMGDAADQAAALGTAGGKFGAFTKGIASLSGGFTALQGAIGLAGGDAKTFEKTMQKVQSAMALTQGLTALADLGDAFNNMKVVAVNAFKAIKGAIGATGIGLLVIALGTIVAYWDDIKAAISGVSAEQEALNAETAANAQASQENLDALTASEEQLKLAGKSEEEIYQLKIKQYDTTIADAKAKQAADKQTLDAQIAASQRNKDILSGIIQFLTAPLQLLLGAVDEVGKALGQDFGLRDKFNDIASSLLFDPEELKKEGEKAAKESAIAINKLEEQRAGLINGHNDKAKAARQKRIDEAKAAEEKAAEEEKRRLEKHQQDVEKLTEEAAKRHELIGLSEREKELKRIEQSYRDKEELAKGNAELEVTLAQNKADDIAAINAKFDADEKAAAEKAAEEKKKADEDAIKAAQDKADKELEIEMAKLDAKLAIQTAELDLVAQVGSLVSQLAGKNKKAQIAGLVIEQAAAIGKVIANTGIANAKSIAASPITAGMPWVAINTASAALSIGSIVAGVAKSIQQINSSGEEGGGGAGGGGGAAPKPAASKFADGGMLQGPSHGMGGIKTAMGELEGGEFVINKRSTANFLPLIQAINEQGKSNSNSGSAASEAPIFKTYVVSSEMTSQQEANKRVDDIARL